MKKSNYTSLSKLLERSFKKHQDLIALDFGDKKYTYKDLDILSGNIASFLNSKKKTEEIIGVFAKKNFLSYAAFIGIVRSGKTYLPLNPKFPVNKLKELVELSKLNTIIGEEELSFSLLKNNLSKKLSYPSVKEIGKNSFNSITDYSPEQFVYLLFTSGTTGYPKGIRIKNKNICCYLENAKKFCPIGPGDVSSQTFDLTFDPSIHDILNTLCNGACIAIPRENELISPASYIKERKITHWYSVPSLAKSMDKLKQLKENNFSRLKNVLFAGEALTVDVASKFMKAAPNAITYNIYGPTEATIVISGYKINAKKILQRNSIVSIGKIFKNNRFQVSKQGELIITGKQVIENYFNNHLADLQNFIVANNERKYKTGDIVERDKQGNLYYIGRKDDQLKLNGYRIEPFEIESAFKKESGCENAFCFSKSIGNSTVLMMVLEGKKKIEHAALIEKCRKLLPPYMLPQLILYLPEFPKNVNGKIDRKKIIKLTDQ